MSVNKEIALHVGKLARLNLVETEKLELFARQMEQIVEYMDILKSADTAGEEPLFSPMRRTAPLREDVAHLLYTRDEELANAPEKDAGFFLVPRIL
ncbi:MAG: Asp-tRNA(Asn)/Glu-tRNA(Gln) amidotransferase subunit GatC [Deltaproteobacteria bacterium]|jgi:aspartyl-tRNA(Asn)/glutamyl-tRNA(Gln) amidotransferase subunit C|nr:Asp-tRNA(Asn)/Glu-tRNA(Gln) amidotransferase subunit GatC [Deltaproteobacteria bacterium]